MTEVDTNFKFPRWMGEHPRLNAPWTKAEEDVLVQSFRAGDSLEKIARKHGRACGGIESRLMTVLGDNFYSLQQKNNQDADFEYLRATVSAIGVLLKDVDRVLKK